MTHICEFIFLFLMYLVVYTVVSVVVDDKKKLYFKSRQQVEQKEDTPSISENLEVGGYVAK